MEGFATEQGMFCFVWKSGVSGIVKDYKGTEQR